MARRVVVALLLLGALMSSSSPAAAGATACAPLFVCPSGPMAPSVVLGATSASSSTAELSGTIDPGGMTTTYQFVYAETSPVAGTVLTTPATALLASDSVQEVSATLTGLAPGSTYAVALVASNAVGSRSDTGEFTTLAAARPTLTIGPVNLNRSTVVTGTPVVVTAYVSGQIGTYTLDFGPPRATLQSRPSIPALGLPSIATVNVSGGGVAQFLAVTPTRNTEFRVRVAGATSAWVRVYVKPLLELYTTADHQPPGDVELAYSAGGELPRGYRRGPVAYFYRGRTRSGPFRRVAAAVFRRTGVSFYARTTVRAPRGGYYVACTRTPIIPHMGRPFRDLRCGALRLP